MSLPDHGLFADHPAAFGWLFWPSPLSVLSLSMAVSTPRIPSSPLRPSPTIPWASLPILQSRSRSGLLCPQGYKISVIASFLSVATNILIVSLTLDAFQHKAIALSTSITMIVNFFFLSAVLYRKVEGMTYAT